MHRLFSILLVVLLASAALTGCFGDDGDDDSEPSPSPTPTPTAGNNTTNETNLPPIPVINVTLEADGEAVEGPPFLVTTGSAVNITFDANASSDPDGEIQAYAWSVESDAGFTATSTEPTFVADVGEMSQSRDFGLFHVSLIVFDGEYRTEARASFAVDYHSVRDLPNGMLGPGTDSRTDANEDKVNDNNVGTYNVHQVTLGENATTLDLTLTYASSTTGQLKLYLFNTSVAAEDDTASATPTNESGAAASPITLTETEDLEPGTWWIRVELAGVSISSYSLEIVVNYAVPADDAGGDGDDEEGDGEEGDGEEGDGE